MSLQTVINIKKGWPNPSIVEDSLPVDETVLDDANPVLGQGEVVTISDDRKWKRGVSSVDATPYIITVDSDDPSTGRSAHKAGYRQVKYGNVHGISLSNALEIETAFYKTDDTYAIGTPLSAPTGRIKVAESNEVIVGVVSKTPYTLGSTTYLTFVAENGKRKA